MRIYVGEPGDDAATLPFREQVRDIVANGPLANIAYTTAKNGGFMAAEPRQGSVVIDITGIYEYEDLCELNAFVFAVLCWINATGKYERR